MANRLITKDLSDNIIAGAVMGQAFLQNMSNKLLDTHATVTSVTVNKGNYYIPVMIGDHWGLIDTATEVRSATDLDTGTVAALTKYYVYVVTDGNALSFKTSLSATNPTGYDTGHSLLLGDFTTDAAKDIVAGSINGVNHMPFATAENDVIMAGPTPIQWVKKTLVQFMTAIGLNIIAGGTTGFTLAGGGKTLTVDEAVSMSSKAPKASPSFTGDSLNTSESGQMAVQNPTNAGVHYIGSQATVSVGDNQTFTFYNASGLFVIYAPGLGKAAVFMSDWASGTISKLADPSNVYEITDTDTSKICVYKSASSSTITLKNYTNSTITISINVLGGGGACTAPA